MGGGANVAESTPMMEDHDGFVEAIYHLLWAKNFNGEPCNVLVPDVVLYKYRIPAYWYFTGSDGRLRRKNKSSIVNQKIYKDFTAGARSDKDVVACHICEHPLDGGELRGTSSVVDGRPPARTETVIRYFDKAGLKDFLFHQEKLNDGCLQKFVRPKGLFNSMIQAAWSPQMCLLERRVNLVPLLSGRAPLQERTATYEGSEHLSRITPVRGTLLADRVQQLCSDMVQHITATSHAHQRISRMLVNFKTDAEDNVWFLWCASVRLAGSEPDADTVAAPPTGPSHATASPAAARSGGVGLPGDPSLAPVCLNPAMSSPARSPVPKKRSNVASAESVCPFTGKPLDDAQPYFVTYRTLLDYTAMCDAKSRIRRPANEVPPLLQRVCPDLDGDHFARERANPLSLFLYTRVLCSEEAYLDFSSAALPGVKVLPAIPMRARRTLLASSASAPSLPNIRTGSRGILSMRAPSAASLVEKETLSPLSASLARAPLPLG